MNSSHYDISVSELCNMVVNFLRLAHHPSINNILGIKKTCVRLLSEAKGGSSVEEVQNCKNAPEIRFA